jgi:hypothetical protein
MVLPLPSKWAEHIPPHDPGADTLQAPKLELVIDACRPFRRSVAVEPLKSPRCDMPLVDSYAADAEGVVDVLARPGAESVDRNPEAGNLEPSHIPSTKIIHGGRQSPLPVRRH